MTVGFEQAAIKVQKEAEFRKLQAAIEQAFLPEKAERFLKHLDRKGIRVRDFDGVLAARALEDAVGSQAALSAWQLYRALPFWDRAKRGELFLAGREGIDATLRHKFKKLYQYY